MTTPPTTRNETALLPQQHLWVGTYHGTHHGDRVVVTTTRDDTQPLPYGLDCTCGLTQRHTDMLTLDRAAWRHTHPTLRERLTRRLRRRVFGSAPTRQRAAKG